tara:strand:- start:715 stop:1350 length:636 start_codon:yes stop_codon:yes gene_type:complete
MSYEHIDSWKNESVFLQQLKLNLYQFRHEWPTHWNHFVSQVRLLNTKIDQIVDIGCGCGAYSLIVQKEFNNIDYIGFDYSSEAIKVSKESFGEIGKFEKKSYQEINSDDVCKEDLVLINGLIDILPEGNKCLEHIIRLNPRAILLQRIALTQDKSYHEVYETPYGIKTYKFYYNKQGLIETIKKNGYVVFKWDTFDAESVDILIVNDNTIR